MRHAKYTEGNLPAGASFAFQCADHSTVLSRLWLLITFAFRWVFSGRASI